MIACPNCGSTELATMESLIGDAFCTIDDDGRICWEGETEIDWDSSETVKERGLVQIRCRSCWNQYSLVGKELK